MEWIEAHLHFLFDHLLTVVFAAFLIEAAGLPFPTRLLLIVAATLAEPRQLVGLVAATTAGSLMGDHVPYVAGTLTGPRILAFECTTPVPSTHRYAGVRWVGDASLEGRSELEGGGGGGGGLGTHTHVYGVVMPSPRSS